METLKFLKWKKNCHKKKSGQKQAAFFIHETKPLLERAMASSVSVVLNALRLQRAKL
jgi:hypothetical protein